MNTRFRIELFVGAILLFTVFGILRGVSKVPFHPDETSILYQSRDLERWLTDPGALYWDPDRTGKTDQTYRLLNPPLPKYILGVARRLAGYSADQVSVDWNWSETWEENLAAGAYPDRDLLLAGRNASAVLAILALLPLALSAKRLGGTPLAVLVLILYLSNALVLLHGRRLLAEGTLLFGVSLAIYGILEAENRPWLAGVGAGVAACSKLSALPLIPVGLVAAAWGLNANPIRFPLKYRKIFTYLIVALVVIFLLNPVLWSDPLQGTEKIWEARVDFTTGQVETLEAFAPGYVLTSPIERVAGMIFHLFFAPPQTYEVGNYLSATESAIERYLSNPLHSIGRSRTGGVLAIGLVILGIVSEAIEYREKSWGQRRDITLLFIATAVQTIALLWANPIPFQRYYIPLIPFMILWIGIGLNKILQIIKKAAAFSQRPLEDESSSYSRK